MKKIILLLSFIMVSGFAIGQTAPIKKKNYVDEQRILNVEAATPRAGYISAPYRKTDGRWYEKDENGLESTIVGREDVYITTDVPTGNFSYKMAIDTVGIDTMYINNNSNWNRFESGGSGGSGGSAITDGSTIIGTGEIGDSLRIDTTVIATQYDISNISRFVSTFAEMESLTNLDLGSLVVYEPTGATYKIQTDSIAGTENGGFEVREVGVNFAILQGDNGYNVKWFGGVGDSLENDTDAWQNAINFAGDGGLVLGENGKAYKIYNSLSLDSIQNFTISCNGKFSFLRPNGSEVNTTLAVQYSGSGNMVVDYVPSNWRIGDILRVIEDDTNAGISTKLEITGIVGNSISLSTLTFNKAASGTPFIAPIGSIVIKDLAMIKGRLSATEGISELEGANREILIENIIFDGNKANNLESGSWFPNITILIHGKGSEIRNCVFKNMYNEVISGGGLSIHHNVFENCGGSPFHGSVHDNTISENVSNSFSFNTVTDCSTTPYSVNGHNEGVISFSWNGGGAMQIVGNYFFNTSVGDAAVFGYVGPAGVANDRGYVVVSGNQAYNFAQIFSDIDSLANPININGNIFSNCGSNNFSNLLLNTGFDICGNTITNGTSIIVNDANKCDSGGGESISSGNDNDVLVFKNGSWKNVPQQLLQNDTINYWSKTGNNLYYSGGDIGINIPNGNTLSSKLTVAGEMSVHYSATLPSSNIGVLSTLTSSTSNYETSNAYFDSGWKYNTIGGALQLDYNFQNSTFKYNTAPTGGTAGTALTWTEQLNINPSGVFIPNSNLGLGISVSPQAKLHVKGNGGVISRLYNSSNSIVFSANESKSVTIGGSSDNSRFVVIGSNANDYGISWFYNDIANNVPVSWFQGPNVFAGRRVFNRIGTHLSNNYESVTTEYKHVGDVNQSNYYKIMMQGGTNGLSINGFGDVGIGIDSPTAKTHIVSDGSTTDKSFFVENSDGDDNFTILDGGNVGVGTATPDRKLDIENGTLRLSDLGGGTFTGTETYLLGVESDGDVVEVDLASGMDAVVSSRSYVDNTAALVDLVSGQVYYNTTSSTFVVLP